MYSERTTVDACVGWAGTNAADPEIEASTATPSRSEVAARVDGNVMIVDNCVT